MNSYRLKKERERTLFSAGIVAGGFLFVILLSLIFNLFKFEDFTDYSGPVKITFGSPESEVEVAETVKQPVEDIQPEPEPQPEPVNEPEPKPIKEEVKEVIPEVVKDNKVEPKPEPVREEVVKEPTPTPAPEPVIPNGRESGNSHETSFESSSSKIGRRAYFPIYQFMPLPKTISMDTFALITGDITGFGEENYNKGFFNRFYTNNGGFFELNDTVPYDNRPYLWGILEAAGYNIDNAEYKQKYSLKPVIIVFEVNSSSTGSNAIKSAKIDRSSGVAEIDDAVLYGFKQSTYSNSTTENVKGRFKYSFDNP